MCNFRLFNNRQNSSAKNHQGIKSWSKFKYSDARSPLLNQTLKASFIKSSFNNRLLSSVNKQWHQNSPFSNKKSLDMKMEDSHPQEENWGNISNNLKASIWNNPNDNSSILKIGELMIISEEFKVCEGKFIWFFNIFFDLYLLII